MMDRHRAYFERRLVEERLAAANSQDPFAGLAHLAFVRLYKMRLAAPPPSPLATAMPPSMPMATARSGESNGANTSGLCRQSAR